MLAGAGQEIVQRRATVRPAADHAQRPVRSPLEVVEVNGRHAAGVERASGLVNAVLRRLGGTARVWRTDRMATVIVPGSADASYLIKKLEGAPGIVGVQMPRLAPPLPQQEIDRVARSIITAGGYGGQFIHRTGHGIGLAIVRDIAASYGGALTIGCSAMGGASITVDIPPAAERR